MKTYILSLKQKSGLLSELQSDTIYGHFCWRLKERLGEEKLTEFISAYKSNKPVFTLSDGLLKIRDEIHFPRPFIFSKPKIREKKADKIIEFAERKRNKERNYLTLSELNSFLSTGQIKIEEKKEEQNNNTKPKKNIPVTSESLRVSVQIDRSTFGSSEGKLFSYNPKHTRDDVSYVILIKVLDEEAFKNFDCKNLIEEVFKVGYGKKKSSGYGQFDVGEMAEFSNFKEVEDPNAFIVVGNYLPAEKDNITPVGYDINTKYGKLGEELSQSENPFKNPIVFITAGSCFKTVNSKEFYGRITNEGEISQANSFAVQFGIPFTLNLKHNSTD